MLARIGFGLLDFLMARFLAMHTFVTILVLAALSFRYLAGFRSVLKSFGGAHFSDGFGGDQSSNRGVLPPVLIFRRTSNTVQ